MESNLSQPELTMKTAFEKNFTLPQIFENIITISKQRFSKDKVLMTVAFLIIRKFDTDDYKVMIVPMPAKNDQEKDQYFTGLKEIVTGLKKSGNKEFKLVGVIRGADASVSIYEKGQVMNKDGTINDKIPRPLEDKSAKNVLLFELEEAFVKHTKAFEYIISEEGHVVIDPTPLFDTKNIYDPIMDKNSRFAFVFTEGQGCN